MTIKANFSTTEAQSPEIGAILHYMILGVPIGVSTMNVDQLVKMIFRMFLRKTVNKGMNAGLNRMAGGQKQGQSARQQTKRARQAMKVTRRLNKF